MTIRAQSVHKSVADSRSEERGGYRGVLEVHLDIFRGVLKYFAKNKGGMSEDTIPGFFPTFPKK